MNERELETWLPPAEEMKEMDLSEFSQWLIKANYEIRDRKKKRNPKAVLKAEILLILNGPDLSDEMREDLILKAIKFNNANYRNPISER